MRGEQGAIEAVGARLVFVGSGSTAQARHFERKYAPGNAIFTDPSAYTYRAIGAHAGVASTLAGTFAHGMRAMRGRHFQTSIEGRVFQHGGVLIALPGDVAAYAYISRMAGDHPPSVDILRALYGAVHAAAAAAATAPEQPQYPAPPASAIPSMALWPGATRQLETPRTPRWSFEVPPSEPPRSAAG